MKKLTYIFDSFAVIAYLLQLVESTMARILSAAHIKAQYVISYADAFVVALSHERKGIIVTADPEFKQVESLVDILWL